MGDYILECKNLTKKFGNQYAVKDLSLSIRRNSIFGLLGPNGAGKSTSLKMFTNIMKASSGEIYFDGHPLRRGDLEEIGFLIESPGLYPNLTAEENLKLATIVRDIPESRIGEIMDLVGLKNPGKKKVKNFSMGMKQRLGLGLALIHRPKLLILDEPTNGLDPVGIGELRDLIRSFPAEGITVIISSHILTEVSQLADEVAIISNGQLGFQARMDQVDNLEEEFMEVVKSYRREDL